MTAGPAIAPQRDYVGRYLKLTVASGPLELWLFATVAGGRYNAPGEPDSVWLAERPDKRFPAEVRDELARMNVPFVRDIVGFSGYRRRLALEEVRLAGDHEAQVRHVASWVTKLIRDLRALAS